MTEIYHRFETYEEAKAYSEANNLQETHEIFKTNYVVNPWQVTRYPQVGDEVSKVFNGDYYPQGTIVKVSPTRKKIVTSEGSVFWRKGKDFVWLQSGTWSLFPGHTNKRNPHF